MDALLFQSFLHGRRFDICFRQIVPTLASGPDDSIYCDQVLQGQCPLLSASRCQLASIFTFASRICLFSWLRQRKAEGAAAKAVDPHLIVSRRLGKFPIRTLLVAVVSLFSPVG